MFGYGYSTAWKLKVERNFHQTETRSAYSRFDSGCRNCLRSTIHLASVALGDDFWRHSDCRFVGFPA